MLLSNIFKTAPAIEIDELSTDSRMPMHNAIFFCISGIKYDGHDFVKDAIENGAKVIVYERAQVYRGKAIYVKVNNVNETLIKVANVFYNNPSSSLIKYVISGNYGKSSVSTFINFYLNKYIKCAYAGIFGIKYDDKVISSDFPTLTALENIKLLNELRNHDIKAITFEATSSALNLKKLDVIDPNIFVYTNTCEEGIEFSKDYYSYIRRYLYTLSDNTKIVLNYDDPSFYELNEAINNYVTYGQDQNCDYQILSISVSKNGIKFNIKYDEKLYKVESKLLGLANVYNLTAAIVALNQSGYELDDIIEKFKELNYVEGVYEKINNDYNIIVDCAYDLNSIEDICKFASNTYKGNKYVVIGINYSDDEYRIEKIIDTLEKYMDTVILTEDESLDSSVYKILEKTDKYVKNNKFVHIGLRSLAIKNGIDLLNKDDVLLILGKGSEKYLSMGLGKVSYLGDKNYAQRFLNKHIEDFEE